MYRLIFIGIFLLFGCQSSVKNIDSQSNIKNDILTGQLPVAIDESLFPLLQDAVSVFHGSYPNSVIQLLPAAEIVSINALLKDKAQIAILTRELNSNENEYFTQRGITPRIYKIGYDALVLINAQESADTSINVSTIIDLMKGNAKNNTKLVFEDVNASAVRYLKELGKLEKVSGANVEIVGGLDSLVRHLYSNHSSIGVISLTQYLNAKQSFGEFDKIRILSVQNNVGDLKDATYYKPSQSTLATENYPLRRPIYILNYQPNTGLGIGFSAFLTGDRGQRIVLKSGLLPESMPGRELIIRDNVN